MMDRKQKIWIRRLIVILTAVTLSYIAFSTYQEKQLQRQREKDEVIKGYLLKLERQTAIAENALAKVHEKEKRIDTLEKKLAVIQQARFEMKPVWNNAVVIAKEKPDTSAIKELDRLHNISEKNCEEAIGYLQNQVTEYQGISLEKDTVIQARDSTISIQNAVIDHQNGQLADKDKQVKKEKRKVFFAKVFTGVALVLMVLAAV